MTNVALPVRHISIRVPWSDLGWTGQICRNPLANQACLALKRISANRDDGFEAENAGRAWSELSAEQLPPCAEEHGAFMSDHGYQRSFTHPYQSFEPGYEGFKKTTFVHPPLRLRARRTPGCCANLFVAKRTKLGELNDTASTMTKTANRH